MASFQKILLCYDSTREGRRALLQGAELAQQLGAETHLLAIAGPARTPVGDVSVGLMSMAPVPEDENVVKEVLQEGVERLRARGLAATGHLVNGYAVDQIPSVAKTLGVDLIVVGHKQRGRIARWWIGPGNAQLLDLVACSILVSIDPTDATEATPP